MSKISKQGYDQIQVIKNALDSMYDKKVEEQEKQLLQEDK